MIFCLPSPLSANTPPSSVASFATFSNFVSRPARVLNKNQNFSMQPTSFHAPNPAKGDLVNPLLWLTSLCTSYVFMAVQKKDFFCPASS